MGRLPLGKLYERAYFQPRSLKTPIWRVAPPRLTVSPDGASTLSGLSPVVMTRDAGRSRKRPGGCGVCPGRYAQIARGYVCIWCFCLKIVVPFQSGFQLPAACAVRTHIALKSDLETDNGYHQQPLWAE